MSSAQFGGLLLLPLRLPRPWAPPTDTSPSSICFYISENLCIFVYLGEGSWGFTYNYCISCDIFAFTLKRLKDFAQKRRFSILKGDLVLGLPTWNKWEDPVHFENTNLFVFNKINLLANLCCPWRSVAGIPISWQRAAHSSISNVKPAIVLSSTQAHLKQ